MKKKQIVLFIIIIIALIIYYFSPEEIHVLMKKSSTSDITENVNINSHKLKVTYFKGNLIDEHIGYGNIYEKIIKIENTSDTDLSYSLDFSDSEINNNKLVYFLSYSEDNTNFNILQEEKSITRDYTLKYNLGVTSKSTLYLKISFKALDDEQDTILKGRLSIKANMTKKDIFMNDVVTINDYINDYFDSINWVSSPGMFTLDLSDTSLKDLSIKGYIVIDASYISNIDYYFFVYSDSYMLDEHKYEPSFNKSDIKEIDTNLTQQFNEDFVCKRHTKKECTRLLDLGVNEGSSKKKFKENVDSLVEEVKKDFDSSRREVVIYNVDGDISNNTGVHGYILINNIDGKEEIYLYLTDYYFMITGYNLTKLGPILTSNTTIKTYVVDAFNLSSESIKKVCTFTGFNDCKDKSGNIIL